MKSPTSPGMSLETFISRDLAAIEQQMQAMAAAEQNEDDNDEQYDTNEKVTTEDILGKIKLFIFVEK